MEIERAGSTIRRRQTKSKNFIKNHISFFGSLHTVYMFYSFLSRKFPLSCTPLWVHFMRISSIWGVTIVIIQLLRGFAHRFTSSLAWINQMAWILAIRKSLGDERERLYDFVVVPFDLVPFHSAIKCTI